VEVVKVVAATVTVTEAEENAVEMVATARAEANIE
jgi:hypothetical protein